MTDEPSCERERRCVSPDIEPITCHVHVLTCLNPEIPQSGTCGELLISRQGLCIKPSQKPCTMWAPTPEIEVSWEELRQFKNNIINRSRFSASFGRGFEGHPNVNIVLRIQLKEKDKKEQISAVFEGLPAEVSAKRAKRPLSGAGVLPAKGDVRMAGLKNIAVSGVWFVISALLFVSGIAMQINRVCTWPQRALSGILSGRWYALVHVAGMIGIIIWAAIMIGWAFSLPHSLFMILTGRESHSLDKLFPAFFKASKSMPSAAEQQEKTDKDEK
ncbi:MAG: hypothetical protein AMJ75_02845 [Phycisphaerae bacterium SM1_79]|nr:MAG: hypothetical protein AMJ75_02845 [Phycisphaerae bacterium SM1_79]